MWGSVSGHVVTYVNDFRNDAEDCKISALEMVGRRAVAGLAYAALSVAALVEMVVRVALGLLLVIPCAAVAACTCDDDLLAVPLIALFTGFVFNPDVSIRCLSAFVQNFYRGEIQYEDLPPFGACIDFN